MSLHADQTDIRCLVSVTTVLVLLYCFCAAVPMTRHTYMNKQVEPPRLLLLVLHQSWFVTCNVIYTLPRADNFGKAVMRCTETTLPLADRVKYSWWVYLLFFFEIGYLPFYSTVIFRSCLHVCNLYILNCCAFPGLFVRIDIKMPHNVDNYDSSPVSMLEHGHRVFTCIAHSR